MSEWTKTALDKLKAEAKEAKLDSKEKAMSGPVRKALEDFCRQDEEFAQAVAQGGSFAECMKAVAKGVGSSISDLDAYKRAVQFYFAGAEISFQMTIDVCPNRVKPEEHIETVILSLEDFL